MMSSARISRRSALALVASAGVAVLSPSVLALAAQAPRTLAFHNLHTGEQVRAIYRSDGRLVPDELSRIDWILRDHRTGEVRVIDRRLLDLAWALQRLLDTPAPFEVISGYRSALTNAYLAATSSGVVRDSLHVQGMAIDIRVPERSLQTVRDAARSLRAGGVGYYPRSDFVHVDVGRVRSW